MMHALPNLLSALRIPLALLFLFSNPLIRIGAILLAMASDILDGFLARKFAVTSRFGIWLDPIADKIFVFFAFFVLLQESSNPMENWQILAVFSRDVAIIFFVIYLALSRKFYAYESSATVCGKVATSLQLISLFILCIGYALPTWIFYLFILIGFCVFIELTFIKRFDIVDK